MHGPPGDLQIIVIDVAECGGFLVFGDAAFKEILLLLDVDHFGKPREGVFGITYEWIEAAGHEAAVGDVVDILRGSPRC